MTSGSEAGARDPDFFPKLKLWVLGHMPALAEAQWTPLNGDAGFRQYYRLSCISDTLGATSLLAVYAPPSTENNTAFVAIAEHLREHGVHTPKILVKDFSSGFFVIEDLGESLYFDRLSSDSVDILYGEALMSLLRLQQAPANSEIFPAYDASRLGAEMALFPEWFVDKLLGQQMGVEARHLFSDLQNNLVESALAQPQCVVHRDYHSRNLVYGPGGTPGVIDFQDAVIGPITYDPVSLLKDCYIAWPKERVRSWALAYGAMAADAELMPAVDGEQFIEWFDLMGLQRHIKVLGIFARLSLRDGKHAYLKDLPQVVAYVCEALADYERFEAFYQWFEASLMPEIRRQSWYQ